MSDALTGRTTRRPRLSSGGPAPKLDAADVPVDGLEIDGAVYPLAGQPPASAPGSWGQIPKGRPKV